jgi:hypothetical protein
MTTIDILKNDKTNTKDELLYEK